ncbi:MAG: hypothetical protein Q4C58_00760 [Eubacteriales bacterium]|nr:hypothetical protein [Eubacteriales bacterium]
MQRSESELNIIRSNLTDSEEKAIDGFLTRRKYDVFWALAKVETATQKQLAGLSGTTTTSLSNILLKFEDFTYTLLTVQQSGRNRYYSLSEVGQAYVRRKIKAGPETEGGRIAFHDELRILQKLKDGIEQLKSRNEEWDVTLDNILLKRIYGIGEECDSADEAIADELIRNLQKAIMNEYGEVVKRVMKLLETDILKCRLEKFLSVFYAFLPFYRMLEKEENTFEIHEIFLQLVKGEMDDECCRMLEQMELSTAAGQLADVIGMLKKNLAGKERKEIYTRLKEFMPEMNEIALYLTPWIEISGNKE